MIEGLVRRSWLALRLPIVAPLVFLAACVCVRPPGSEYPARARLVSVTVVEQNCPAPAEPGTGAAARRPLDESRAAAAAADEASARSFPGNLMGRLLASGTRATSREVYAGFTRELNAFVQGVRDRTGPARAARREPAVKAIVPLGAGQVLLYPSLPAGAEGAQGARGDPAFESFLQALSAPPCSVRIERNFVPEPAAEALARADDARPEPAKPTPALDWTAKAVRLQAAIDLLARRHPGEQPGQGIVLVHLDTGYTRNCQFWDASQGYTPLQPELGFDFFGGADDPADPMTTGALGSRQPGHGTSTGTVLASPYDRGPLGRCHPGQAGDAVQGSAPGVKLVPARVSDGVVLGLPPELALAFPRLDHRVAALAAGVYQAAHGTGQLPRAHVLSMSLGGADCDCPPEEAAQRRRLEASLEEAEAQGLIAVAAAGQYPGVAAAMRPAIFGGKHPVTFPGKWASTIAVSASDVDDQPWRAAARGSEVDVTAPGFDVWVADTVIGAAAGSPNTDAVRTGRGTSFATALVAGIAGLWIHYHGYEQLHGCYQGALASTFRWLLKHGGARRPEGWETGQFGPGIVDAAGLLQAALPNPAEVCESERPRRTPEAWSRLCGFTQGAALPGSCSALVAGTH